MQQPEKYAQMTPQEHYRKAEVLLAEADKIIEMQRHGEAEYDRLVRRAAVHATLATVPESEAPTTVGISGPPRLGGGM